MTGLGLQSFAAVAIVLALVGALAWLARRGAFNGLRKNAAGMVIETAMPLGERRSLVVVAVEGRRLLLGVTPMQVTLVTELSGAAAAAPPVPSLPASSSTSSTPSPAASSPSTTTFEQHLDARP